METWRAELYGPQASLKHYGVKGMRWGIRHERERTGRRTRKQAANSVDKPHRKKYNTGRGLTAGQKRAIRTGAALALAAVAVYGAKKMGYLDAENLYAASKYVKQALGKVGDIPVKQVEQAKPSAPSGASQHQTPPKPQYTQTNQQRQNPQKNQKAEKTKATPVIRDPKTGFRMIHETVEDSLKNANPHRGDPKYQNNCTNCAIAGVLRMLGYDVRAKDTGGRGANVNGKVEFLFKNVPEKNVKDGRATTFAKSPDDAARLLKKWFGDNAAGVVGVKWKGREDGHAFSWMIKDGNVRFLDFQNGSDDQSVRMSHWAFMDPDGILSVSRLDNLREFNMTNASEYLEFD